MSWFNILGNGTGNPSKAFQAKPGSVLGCTRCSLNKGAKLKGLVRVKGRRAMLWGDYPTQVDVRVKREFTGKRGQWLWKELARVGFTREMFDVQNVVRCYAGGRGTAKMLLMEEEGEGGVFSEATAKALDEPTPREINNCSVYSAEALERNQHKATLHLVFGKVAAKALLGDEYDFDRPVCWSNALDARVVCLPSPEYFMNGAPPWKLNQFRQRLKAAKLFYDHPSKFYFLREVCDLKTIKTDAEEEALFSELAQQAGTGNRVSLDVEEGTVDGERKLLVMGFSWAKQQARCLPISHPEADLKKTARRVDRLRTFLNDPRVKKTFQYGPYDTDALRRLIRSKVSGYDFDTTYAHYLVYPFLRSHGLDAIAAEGYPLFGGYKGMVDTSKLGEVPLKTVCLYNNADAALTKQIELDYGKEVPLPLMHTYIWAGITLYHMQQRGPLLDRVYLDYTRTTVRKETKKVLEQIRLLTGDPEFNPAANVAVAKALYETFRFTVPDGEKETATGKEVLQVIHQQTGHPFPLLVLQWRSLSKMEGTYLNNYEKSADLNNGELHTNWYLTGAVTGRLRSGGSKKNPGLINMQNLHGDPMLQNLLVADVNWRDLERYVITQ